MRGGTSRAVVFRRDALAGYDDGTRDRIILAALGSPDPHGRQIDGLGGGISSLSKVAIIGPSDDSNLDVNFTFGQVDVRRPVIDWSGTCGNISAAVGPFAIAEGLVKAEEPVTVVRVLATNIGRLFVAHVPVKAGAVQSEGGYVIDGVPAPGVRITLEFVEPGGSLGRGVLPTGSARQEITIGGGRHVAASIVDVAIPMVYVRAEDVGADPTSSAAELDEDTALQEVLEQIRSEAAVVLGLASRAAEAHVMSQAIPKIAVIAPPAPYETSDGRRVSERDVDLLARAISMGRAHRTFPGSSSMATAVAAVIDGTLVNEAARPQDSERLRIGHPAGVMEVGAAVERDGGDWHVPSVTTYRTARRIMDGWVSVPERYMNGTPWFEESS